MVVYTQNLLLNSFFSKLKVVKSLGFYEKKLLVSDIKKLQIVFNMRKQIFLKSKASIYIRKGVGNSKSFNLPDLYPLLSYNLIYLSLLPYYEFFSNRFSLAYRPFRFSHDTFIFLKNKIDTKKSNRISFLSRVFTALKLDNFFNRRSPLSIFSIKSDNSLSGGSTSMFNYQYIVNSFFNFSIIGLVLFPVNRNLIVVFIYFQGCET